MMNDFNSLIRGSVGLGGQNTAHDVAVVDYLLDVIEQGGLMPGHGHHHSGLVDRIRHFQMYALKFQRTDGRVDPGGRSLRGMLELAGKTITSSKTKKAPPPAVKIAAHRTQASMQQKKVATDGVLAGGGGSGAKLTDADYKYAAERLKPGVQVAMIRAYAEVESGGKSGFGPKGLPVIAFEGHIFRKYSNKIYDHTHPLLSHPYKQKAGPEWQVNNKNQDKAWATLSEAMALHHDAALMACSWGMFQVMGFNYSTCGYASVDKFVAAMKAGESGQLDAFVGFCLKTKGLRQAIQDRNYVQCARLYNGDDYGDYDRRIKTKYEKYSKLG
jgi:N-acetylmuramidase